MCRNVCCPTYIHTKDKPLNIRWLRGFMKRWPEISVPKPKGFEFARAKKSTVTDLLKPVTDIMFMTVLSQVF